MLRFVRSWSAISRSLPQFAPARRHQSRRRLTLDCESLEDRYLLSTAKPTFALQAISPTQVELYWGGPVKGCTGYLVEEATTGYKTVRVHGHKESVPVTVWETLAKLGKNTTNFTVNGLTPSTTIYHRSGGTQR